MWNEIITNKDINEFMSLFGYFHDSCIKEIRYVSGSFVNEDLSMNPINNKRMLDIIFQRQYQNPTAIVMRFIGLNALHLIPCNDNYTAEIDKASIFLKNGYIYWVDCDEMENNNSTWVCADKIQWRIINKCIGGADAFQVNFDFLSSQKPQEPDDDLHL
jgi:hypothetical protein